MATGDSVRPAIEIDWPLAAVMISVVVCMTILTGIRVLDPAILTHTIVGAVMLLIPSPVGRRGGGTWRPPPMPPPPKDGP